LRFFHAIKQRVETTKASIHIIKTYGGFSPVPQAGMTDGGAGVNLISGASHPTIAGYDTPQRAIDKFLLFRPARRRALEPGLWGCAPYSK
jgi:hypothetical protein